MGLQEHKILQENLTIQNLADAPSQGSLTAQQLKAKFDEFPELIRQRFNALIDELADYYPDDTALQLMQARVNAYAEHGNAQAGTMQAGHVRLDGHTITLNEAGQLTALGAAVQVSSYEEALAGLDNGSMMTPLRVKQALNQQRQGLNYALGDLAAVSGDFTAVAWQGRDGLLAAALADRDTEQCSVALYSFNGVEFKEINSLPLAVKVKTLLWSEDGAVLAYVDEQDQPGWALFDGLKLTAGEALTGAVQTMAWRPGGQLAVVWQNSPAALNLYARQGLKLVAQGQLTLAGAEQIAALAYAPYQSGRLAAAARLGGAWHLLLLKQEAAVLTREADQPLPASPAQLFWHPAGQTLALDFADGGTALALYAIPSSGEAAWHKLAELGGGGLSGLSWQGEGHYLAVSRREEGPLYELYAFDGAALLLLAQSLWQGANSCPAFHANGRWLAVLSEGPQGSTLRVQEFTTDSSGRWLVQAADFTAAPGGSYLIPAGVELITIRCFGRPQDGQYFSFWGDYPAQVNLDGGVYALDTAVQARGRGLYRVVFMDEAGGLWRLLPLSVGLAGGEEAEAAADDSLALTPYGGGRLLAKRGRRAATIVVAARDSLHQQAADFVCSGQSDQTVLKQAIATLPASGGKLVLLDGTYMLDSVGATLSGGVYRLLEISRPYVTLAGMGKSTVIKLADNVAKTAGQQFCLICGNAPGLTVRDCLFEGAKAANNSAAKVTALMLTLYAEQSEVQNCVFRNCSEAGINSAAPYAHIHNNWLHGNLYGLYLSGGESFVTANDFYQNSYCGLYATASTDLIINNRVVNNTQCGIELKSCVNSQIAMNTLIGNNSGIRAYSCSFIVVKDNFVRRALGTTAYTTAEKSLLLDNCTDMMVVGNWLRGKEAEATGGARIWASYGGTDWNPVI